MTCIDHGRQGSVRDGYTTVRIDGRSHGVHRVLCAFAHNLPLSDDWVTRHTCGNARCINVNHIVPGTHADNMRDKVHHGRSGKLSDDQVRAIRKDRRAATVIADEYNISWSMVYQIRRRDVYAYVEDHYG